jgi:hypothetical protein
MNKLILSSVRPLVYVFAFVTAFCLAGKSALAKNHIDSWVVIGGNAVLFFVSLFAFFITASAMRSSNPQAFVRAMYGSFMVKFFVVIIAAFVYIMIVKKDVSKISLGVCGLLYIIYTILETRGLNRLLKQHKNG